MANGPNGRGFDPGTRRILEELRDLRVEMKEDRRRSDEDRKRSDEDRKRSDEERKRSDERFERTMRETSRETREYFDRMTREFREDSARREAATQKVMKDLRTDVRTVGLAIVKTLNRHTRLLEHISDHHGRLLERIDRKLGARDNGRPGQGNGRGA